MSATSIRLTMVFWMCCPMRWRSSDDVPKWSKRTEPNSQHAHERFVLIYSNSNGDFHWQCQCWPWPLKSPEAIKVSLACFYSPLCLSSFHNSRSTVSRCQSFSPCSFTLHSSSTKISHRSTAHNIFQCEAVPVFPQPGAFLR